MCCQKKQKLVSTEYQLFFLVDRRVFTCNRMLTELCHVFPPSFTFTFWSFHTSLLPSSTSFSLKIALHSTLLTFSPVANRPIQTCFSDLKATTPTSLWKHDQGDPPRSFMVLGVVWDPFRECEMFWMENENSGISTSYFFSVWTQNMELWEN